MPRSTPLTGCALWSESYADRFRSATGRYPDLSPGPLARAVATFRHCDEPIRAEGVPRAPSGSEYLTCARRYPWNAGARPGILPVSLRTKAISLHSKLGLQAIPALPALGRPAVGSPKTIAPLACRERSRVWQGRGALL